DVDALVALAHLARFRDVDHHRDEVLRHSVIAFYRRHRGAAPDVAAVAPLVAAVARGEGDLAAHHPAGHVEALVVARQAQLARRHLADQVVGGVADEFAIGGVRREIGAVDIPHRDARVGTLEHRAKVRLAGGERLLGALALSDIDIGAGHAHGAAAGVALGHLAARQYPAPFAH